MSAQGRQDFVGRVHLSIEDVYAGAPINNIICKARTEKGAWVEQACQNIEEWRATFRSTYLQWALAINSIHLAAERYADPNWQRMNEYFYVTSLRAAKTGEGEIVRIVEWDGKTASNNHFRTGATLVAYGIIDLAKCFEEWVFALYRCYLNHHPDKLLIGPEYKALKQLRRKAAGDREFSAEWTQGWNKRVDAWQKKKGYDGLNNVFNALLTESGLKRPKSYQQTDVNTWADSLRLVIVLRNLYIHGADKVDDELEELSGKPYSLGFKFKAGDPLELDLGHLQSVECFADQLLSAINLSLLEHPDAGK